MARKRWMIVGGVALAAVVVAGAGYSMRGQIAYAEIATTYAAKTTCSCLHVSGRTLESCMADFPAEARENISVVPEGDRVRATVLWGVISAEAVHEDGFGCRIVVEDER